MKIALYAFAFMLGTALAGAAPAPSPNAPRTRLFANGLHVVIAADSTAASVDVSLWFPAGSREERAGRTGLTQLISGLMFAGSRHYPPGEHQRLIEREGGTTSVFSLADFATLGETVPPASLELALRLEADRMAALDLTAQGLEAARGAIGRGHRDPSGRTGVALGMRKLYQTAFAGHPYRWPAGGVDADLSHITLEDARAWWRDRYGPDGTWLVLSGRLDPDSAEALARRTLGAIPKRGLARPAVPAPVAQTAARRSRGQLDGYGRVLLVGWRTPAARSADAPALNVIDALLTHRRPSRLETELLADTSRFLAVQAGFDQRRDAGLLFVAVLIAGEADSVECERAVTAAVEKVAAAPLPAEVFEAALRQVQVETLFGRQTPAGMGDALGRSAMLTGAATPAPSLENLKRLTPESLRQAAARSLTPAHRTVVWMLPGEPPGAPDARPETPAGPAGAKQGGR
ncbi:MAG: M16 family metallopeptidase [Candidatus Eiseniibacteriota bacterium]